MAYLDRFNKILEDFDENDNETQIFSSKIESNDKKTYTLFERVQKLEDGNEELKKSLKEVKETLNLLL